MERHRDENKPPDYRNVKTESTHKNPQEMANLVEIKTEPGIKLEPDEVDTIEYTVTSNQLAGIFVPKVEKIEADDSGGNEVDEAQVNNPKIATCSI